MNWTKLIPGSIKDALINTVRKHDKKQEIEKIANIPAIELTEKHIKNTVLLVNREVLLKKMPSKGIVAELGVDQGGFSEKILELTKPSKLHLVDLWGSERYNDGKRLSVEDKFKNEIETSQIEINHGYSTEIVNKFPDTYFDWIYIDTAHSYEVTRDELEAYLPKMKEGGIIAGHDFEVGNWVSRIKYGVIEAVHEFCVKHDWEIILLTTETTRHRSFGIRKIK